MQLNGPRVPSTSDAILLIDDDLHARDALIEAAATFGLSVDSATDGFSAIEMLRERVYVAIVLEPLIRHGLNGFAVLTSIEMDQPELLDRLFLLTTLSVETITRTAPGVLARLFRKPAEIKDLASAIAAHRQTNRGSRIEFVSRALLIEDDEKTLQSMRDLLEGIGYDVTIARDGREAIVKLSSTDYAFVLLDLVLPYLGGFAVLDYVRAVRPNLMRRIIITTGMPEKYASIDTTDVCTVLYKPIDRKRLQRALEKCGAESLFEGGGCAPQLS